MVVKAYKPLNKLICDIENNELKSFTFDFPQQGLMNAEQHASIFFTIIRLKEFGYYCRLHKDGNLHSIAVKYYPSRLTNYQNARM